MASSIEQIERAYKFWPNRNRNESHKSPLPFYFLYTTYTSILAIYWNSFAYRFNNIAIDRCIFLFSIDHYAQVRTFKFMFSFAFSSPLFSSLIKHSFDYSCCSMQCIMQFSSVSWFFNASLFSVASLCLFLHVNTLL